MQTQWVYQLRDCPDAEDVELLDEEKKDEEEGRPRQILARQRGGADGLVDGYVLQGMDAQAHTAVCTRVLAGDPDPVAEYLLELLAEVCPKESAR
ncbi:hypothetical protein OG689_42865 [Kitasatospora sp. NBC_00240]|uniref:hypothetical protein n=1 Tax=Kitasatospora sp. NBC_00240 TaxID=2903567 RepID=UPI002257DFB6|nr:hypothetical protein [Kitasatospora sp. NBC_00240]MCX5215889.1 hypothetical protein [Kitasatospora sp. NBC_00240]